MLLEIAKIKATPEAQPRVSLHYPTVEEYAEALRGDAEFPPLIVFFDGTDHWLADGFHRLEAYKQCGYVEVPVDFRKGSKRDAILFSVGANARHGLPRTNEDKRRAVMVLLNDPEWGKKSDRWIAEQAAVSNKLVSVMRGETATVNRSQLGERRGKDGKTRKLPEKKAKSEPPSDRAQPSERRASEEADAKPESERRHVCEATARETSRSPGPTSQASIDPFCGCGSAMRLQAVEAWAEQGEMIFEVLGEAGRDHMLNEWAKRVKRLEGYAA